MQVSQLFTFIENGWGAHSSKIAPCAHSPKLACKAFTFVTWAKIGQLACYFITMIHTFQWIIHLCICWKQNWFSVKLNFSEIGIRPIFLSFSVIHCLPHYPFSLSFAKYLPNLVLFHSLSWPNLFCCSLCLSSSHGHPHLSLSHFPSLILSLYSRNHWHSNMVFLFLLLNYSFSQSISD